MTVEDKKKCIENKIEILYNMKNDSIEYIINTNLLYHHRSM